MAVLKVDEWQSPTGKWYVGDVHTWSGWHGAADVLSAQSLEAFKNLLELEYKAIVVSYNEEKDYLMFYWMKSDYARAHKFKLDVNRIARKKGYEV